MLARLADAAAIQVTVVDHAARLELRSRNGAFGNQLERRPNAEARLQPLSHLRLELFDEVRVRSGDLGSDQQLVHGLAAGDDDPEFAAESVNRAKHVLDRAGINVFSADDEHVVDATVEPVGQARIGAAAVARLVGPARQVAGNEPNHRLRRALQVRVHRRALAAEWHRLERLRIAYLRVDEVLPQMHSGSARAFTVRHPRSHLRHAAHVDADSAERRLNEFSGGGNSGARLPREKESLKAKGARIDALAPRGLGEVQPVGRRAVEDAWLHLARPLDGHQRLSGDARAEGKGGRPEALDRRERSPRADVKAEERANQHAILRPDAGAPENAGVRLADARPVVCANAKHRGSARGSTGAVNPRDLAGLDAEVVAVGRMARLRFAQLVLLHHRKAREVFQPAKRVRRHTRRLPFASIEGALLPRVADLRAQLGEDDRVAIFWVGALDFREPLLLARRRAVGRIIFRRPSSQVQAAQPGNALEIYARHIRSAARDRAMLSRASCATFTPRRTTERCSRARSSLRRATAQLWRSTCATFTPRRPIPLLWRSTRATFTPLAATAPARELARRLNPARHPGRRSPPRPSPEAAPRPRRE